jgi:hypothetical protein
MAPKDVVMSRSKSIAAPFLIALFAIVAGGCGNPGQVSTPPPNSSPPQQVPTTVQQSPAPVRPNATDTPSVANHSKKSLEDKLQEARSDLANAELKLNQIEAELTESMRESEEYRTAKAEAIEWDERVNEYRAGKSSRLAEATKNKMSAHNKIAILERKYRDEIRGDVKYAAVLDNVSRLKRIIDDLGRQIKEQLAKAEQEKKERERAMHESQVARSSGSHSSGGAGTVHVREYTRKDGTHVRAHTRRK